MPATPLDSAIYRGLLGDPDLAPLFTDSADVRAMLLVEGALARAQGALGVIPETSAAAIHRASLEVSVDPAVLSEATASNAVPVPALVTAFRAAMQAPEHAQYIHWGATSQDILDTALILRLRQVLTILEARLNEILGCLADLAERHADTPMAARTYGQAAVVSSFGALAAAWGQPLLRLAGELPEMRDTTLLVSLSGAAGTLSAMGDQGPAIRANLAQALDLGDPGRSWHTDRFPVRRIAEWLANVAAALAKPGEDITLLTRSGTPELQLGGGGASSTMPQKLNPTGPSLLVSLGTLAQGMAATLAGAGPHRDARDGAAWIAEWLTLPQLCLATGAATRTARDTLGTIAPDPDKMADVLAAGGGAIFAEALTFALANRMPRPEAQAEVKRLLSATPAGGRLLDTARTVHPDLDPALFDPRSAMGQAPAEARAFAKAVRGRT